MASNIYSYMSSLEIEGCNTGVDAVTATATCLEGKLAIDKFIYDAGEYISSQDIKKFKFNGATGWSAGSVRYADKYNARTQRDWAILMVTGSMSSLAWSILGGFESDIVKFTRLDICVDVKLRKKALGLPRVLKDGYRGKKRVQLVESLTGDTVYFGSRENDPIFIRIYDKSSEYSEDLGMVWRFELEAKKGLAEQLKLRLKGENVSTFATDCVFGAMREVGLPAPKYGQFPDVKMTNVTLSSDERRLNWLRTVVQPTVRSMFRRGLGDKAVDALGLPPETALKQGRLIFDL